MIKINLLPLEKRKAERTPLPRFGLILANVVMFCSMVVVLLLFYWRVKNLEADLADSTKERDGLVADVAKHDKLFADNESKKQQLASLKSVTGTRPFKWWRVLDALWDVVQENPKVWLDSIEILDGRAAEAKLKPLDPDFRERTVFGIQLRCHTSGMDVSNMTKFRMALKDHPLLKGLFPVINYTTDWNVTEQKDFVEGVSLDFEVTLANTGQMLQDPGTPTP